MSQIIPIFILSQFYFSIVSVLSQTFLRPVLAIQYFLCKCKIFLLDNRDFFYHLSKKSFFTVSSLLIKFLILENLKIQSRLSLISVSCLEGIHSNLLKYQIFIAGDQSSKSCLNMRLVDNLVKFANETSIGGFVHIAKSSSSKTKRITWFLIFCLSIIYAGFQIKDEVKCKFF